MKPSIGESYNGGVVGMNAQNGNMKGSLVSTPIEQRINETVKKRDTSFTNFPTHPMTYQPRLNSRLVYDVQSLVVPLTNHDNRNLLHAAWVIVIARYSDSDNVSYASLSEEHGDVTSEPVQLHFVLDDEMTISEFIRQADTIRQNAMKIQDLSHDTNNFKGTESKQMGTFSNLLVVGMNNPKNAVDVKPRRAWEFAGVGLRIDCLLTSNCVSMTISFDDNIIDAKQMKRIVQQYEHVFQALAHSSPEHKLIDIDMITPADIKEIAAWNGPTPQPDNECVHDVIQEMVTQYPESPAVCSWDGELTYRELNELSGKLAAHLVTLGVGPEKIVPVAFEKSKWAIVSMFAVLKAGGACCFLDPSHPELRLETIIREVEALVVLTSATYSEKFTPIASKVLQINESAFLDLPKNTHRLEVQAHPGNTALIVFTSGTTNKPKAIVLEHKSVCASIRQIGKTTFLDNHSRAFQFSAYTFDMAYADILGTLSHGGCVCVPSEMDRVNDLAGAINRLGANVAHLTPTVLSLLSPDEVGGLKVIVIGGEAVSKKIINDWAEKVVLICSYGPAECTIYSVSTILKASDATGTIGRSIACTVWVAEADASKLAPVGTIGELLIEGPIVARGYLNDPVRTEGSFIISPPWGKNFENGSPKRLYRTGDMVKYLSDGSLQYFGRRDTQVKLRGQRIELGEVEYQIEQNIPDGMKVAAELIVPTGGDGTSSLAAFISIRNNTESSETRLNGIVRDIATKEYLSQLLQKLEPRLYQLLPRYMVPTIFVPLYKIPLTASGKTDRKSLRALASEVSTAEVFSFTNIQKRVSPSSEMEKRLHELWRGVLNINADMFGVEANFFRLGGDSVTAMRLVTVARAVGLLLTVEKILTNPKLSDMANATIQVGKRQESMVLAPFESVRFNREGVYNEAMKQCDPKGRIEDIYPCTPLQEGLMVLSIRVPGAYVAQFVYLLPDLDLARFKSAWNSVIARTPIMRTRIIDTHSVGYAQVVVDEPPMWSMVENTSLSSYLKQDQENPMDFGRPLTRYSIVNDRSTEKRYFIWTAHHATYDGWSKSLILQEVLDVYRGISTSSTEAGYFSMFIKHLSDAPQEDSESFWRTQLIDAPATTFPALPTSTYQPLDDASVTHSVCFTRKAQSEVTMSTVVRAAWALLLARYENADDIIFGNTLSGRNSSADGINQIIGPTLTTVPVRVRVQEQSVGRFLGQIQKQSIEMIPFEQTGLQNIRKLSSGAQVACDFRTLLIIQTSDFNDIEDETILGLQQLHLRQETIYTYPITLTCTIEHDVVNIRASFDSTLIETPQMQRIIQQFGHLLQQLSTENSGMLSEMELVSPEDKAMIGSWNNDLPIITDACIHDFIEKQVVENAQAEAIESWEGTLTYQELDTLSTTLAGHLINIGVRPEVFVALCFEKSMWAIVAMLAVLKAGGAFVPLDPAHPQARIECTIEDLDTNIVLTSPLSSKNLAFTNKAILVVTREAIENLPATLNIPPVTPNPRNVAYAMSTSGTTGRAKCFVVEHQSYCSGAISRAPIIKRNRTSRVLQFASFSFDPSLEDILTTLMMGGCICVPSESDRMNDIVGFMTRTHVNFANLTPAFANLLTPELVPELKILLLSGEPMNDAHIKTWSGSPTLLMNGYGPSECSVKSAVHPCVDQGTGPTNIGRAVGSLLWIADSSNHNRLAPVGSIGELLIEGPSLSRGYIKNPEKTAAAFIDCPTWRQSLGPRDGQKRLYKTGDLVQYNQDGTISYIGRRDTQVKLRGHRVELGDIESNICQVLPETAGAIVELVNLNGQSSPTLAAFINLGGAEDEPENFAITPSMKSRLKALVTGLEHRLSQVLPLYMVPSTFIPLNAVPLTVNGKTDRKKLRLIASGLTIDMLADYSSESKQSRLSFTGMETHILELWIETLQLGSHLVRVDDNFFRLGGDSLSAVRLSSYARAKNLYLTVEMIFENPTLARMSLAVHRVDEKKVLGLPSFALVDSGDVDALRTQASIQCGINSALIEDIYPCTPLQDGLMALSIKVLGSYVSQSVYVIPDSLDISRLKSAWAAVAKQHVILRTIFIDTPSLGSMQVVVDKDLDWYSEDIPLEDFLSQDARKPMVMGDSLSRYAIVQNHSTAERYFVWTAHHAIYDRWSATELFRLLDLALRDQLPSNNPSVGFNTFIQYLIDSNEADSKSFWSSYLSNAPTPSFPAPISQYVTHEPRTDAVLKYDIRLPEVINYDVTMATIVKAAWALLVAGYENSNDIIFGMTLSGRNAPVAGIIDIVGPTIATLPVRVQFDLNHRVGDFFEDITRESVSMIPFEQAGLQNIKDWCPPQSCNFKNLLIIQTPRKTDMNDDGLRQVHRSLENPLTYSLVMECSLSQNLIEVEASYDTNFLDKRQMKRIIHQFEHVIHQLWSAKTTDNISDIEIASPMDIAEIRRWNGEPTTAVDSCLHYMVEERCWDQPQAPAVCSWDGDLSYAELDELSTRFAYHLQSLGVGLNTMVPFCMEKSLWTIVVILAILKAGGVVVPLSNTQGRGRQEIIIKEVSASIILVSSAYANLFEFAVEKLVVITGSSIRTLPALTGRLTVTQATDPAYVMFTSGSTGKPKGILQEHQGLCTAMIAMQGALNFTKDGRILQFASYTFDVSISDIFATLIAGGCVCIPSEEERLGDLTNAINNMQVNQAYITSTVCKLLIPSELPSLRYLALGGEPMAKENLLLWADHVHLVNSYGVTESAVWTAASVSRMDKESRPANFGRGFAGWTWIADAQDHNKLAPIGAEGELLIEGPVLARCYLNNQSLTDAAFVMNPQWSRNTESSQKRRLYKTGDIVKYDSNGNLNFVCRKDTQVKLRGQRFELGDVEHCIQSCLSNSAFVAAEIAKPADGNGASILVAFICPEGEKDYDELPEVMLGQTTSDAFADMIQNIKSRLLDSMPRYMIPTAYIPISVIPTLNSGKMNRKELRKMASEMTVQQLSSFSGTASEKPQRSPTTAMQEMVRMLWAKMLSIDAETIGIDDNFLDLGADSIMAMRLASAARKSDISLSVQQIFNKPVLWEMSSVARLLDKIEDADAQIPPFSLLEDGIRAEEILDQAGDQCGVVRESIADIYPCTPLQVGIMALSEETGSYISQMVFLMPDSLNVARFQDAWTKVAQFAAILRTRIVYTSSGPLQVVVKNAIPWSTHEELDLDTYLLGDSKNIMRIGQPLNRFAIVGSTSENSVSSSRRYFVWTVHHATYDGWTLPRILDLVEQTYSVGDLWDLPQPKVVNYNKFIKYLAQNSSADAAAFWCTELDNATPSSFPALPSVMYRPLADAYLKANITISSEKGSMSGIRFTTMIRAAWALIIARYEKSTDVTFGTTLSGRNAPVSGIEDMIGPTIASVPLRMRFDTHQLVGDFFDSIQAQFQNMIPFEQSGLQNIKHWIPDNKALCDFRNLLIIHSAAEQYPTAGGHTGIQEIQKDSKNFLTYPIVMECTPIHDGYMSIHASYDSTVIDSLQMGRLVCQFEHVLQQLCNPGIAGMRIQDIDMVGPADMKQITEWNKAAPIPPTVNSCIHHLVEQRSQRQPDSPAICSWDGNLTYSQLGQLSSRLAQHLVETNKIQPEELIPLSFEKSLWAVVAMLAILKVGGVCVPIDPLQPKARQLAVFKQIDAKLILTSPSYAGNFVGMVPRVVAVSERFVNSLAVSSSGSDSCDSIQPSHGAFVVFTSGSTGEPKGIILEHRSVCTSALEHGEVMRMTADSRVLQFASYTFDVSLGDIFTTLIYGGCVCVPSEYDRMNDLAGAITALRANQIYLTSTVASHLEPDEVKGLEVLSVGGEKVTKDVVQKWADRLYLINIYGPAECTIWCSGKAGLTVDDNPSNVGHGIGGRMWIVDPENWNQLSMVGTVGEVLVEGPVLARGYLKDEVKTKAAFLNNPAWNQNKNTTMRLYRTGDLGYHNSDGSISISGRKDTQVKLRGQRIEVSEVELHTRASLLSPTDVVVELVVKEAPRLVAFVCVGNIGNDQDIIATSQAAWHRLHVLIEGLENRLSLRLPSYMVPSAYIPITSIPLSVSGKTDRKKLQEVVSQLSIQEISSYSAARKSKIPVFTDMERHLQTLWMEVLKFEPDTITIGADDNFLRLGGDSVIAMRLVTAARALGLYLSVEIVFKAPILSEMASLMTVIGLQDTTPISSFELAGVAVGDSMDKLFTQASLQCGLSSGDIEDIYPCSPLQGGLFALSIKQPGSYVGQFVFSMPAELDVRRFQQAWTMCAEKTAIMRTRFFQSDSSLMQVVVKKPIEWHFAEDLELFLQEDKELPMLPGHALARFAICNNRAGMAYFVLSAHHAIYDGFSMDLFFQTVARMYLKVKVSPIVGYNHFIRYLSKTDKEAAILFWKSQLAEASPPSFPILPSINYQPVTDNYVKHEFSLPKRTDFDILLSTIIRAAWSLLLARYSDPESPDVVFGATLSGRTTAISGIDQVMGPTIATVPIRVALGQDIILVDLLRDIQTQATNMIPFEHSGLQNIMRISNEARLACGFQTLLVIQTEAESGSITNDLGLRRVTRDTSRGFHTFAINMECTFTEDGLSLMASFDSKVIHKDEMQRMLYQFEHVLKSICSEKMTSTIKVSEIEIISPADVKQIEAWNGTAPHSSEVCVHHLVQQRVLAQKSAPAVCSWEGNLTYIELDELSSRLARYLITLGVGPGVLVPLLFEKSLWTVVAMLAILKAGGACVSLEPAHPVDRLRGILQDIRAQLLLSSGLWKYKALELSGSESVVVVDAGFMDSLPFQAVREEQLSQDVNSKDPAFILFTSGSTGKPKGIIIDHSAFSSSIAGHASVLRYIAGSRNLQFTAYTSDVSIGEIFTSLSVGACVCIPSDYERMNDLAGAMERMRVDWAFLTPSVATLLHPLDVPTLKTLVFGGETATRQNIETWAPAVYLINSFGPAECSIWTHCNPGIAVEDSGSNIGVGIGCLTWITEPDDHNKLAPIGAIGELLIEGPNIARGYLNNEEKSNAAFIENPAWMPNSISRRRLYKLGDLARYLPDGKVQYIGRKDGQVKLRGQRIEVGEIEHQIRQCVQQSTDDVPEIAVEMVRPVGGKAPPMLAAFFSVGLDAGMTQRSSDIVAATASGKQRLGRLIFGLRARLVKTLPVHMIPSVFIPLFNMPLTASAKTDRKILRQIAFEMTLRQITSFSPETTAKIPPSTEMEKAIHRLWMKTLKLDTMDIGVDDSFLQLGGDSLAAMRLVSLALTVGIEISVADIFRNPVLHEMARNCRILCNPKMPEVPQFSLLKDTVNINTLLKDVSTELQVSQTVIDDIYPCTPLQDGLMALSIMEFGAYTSQFVYEMPSTIDLARFRSAWEKTFTLSPILRTRFIHTSTGTLQIVLKETINWKKSMNLYHYLEEDKELATGTDQSLSRFAIIEEGSKGHIYFVLSLHHAAYDGWSLQTILTDVENNYHARQTKPPLDFNKFIKYVGDVDQVLSESFWRTQLDGAPSTSFPFRETTTPQVPKFDSMKYAFDVRRDQSSGITLATITRAAWALIVAIYLDSDDVCFGATLSGRSTNLSGIESINGPTITTVPIRIRFDRQQSVESYLQVVQSQYSNMIPFEQMGLQNIRKLSTGAREACNFGSLLVTQVQQPDANNSFLGLPKIDIGSNNPETYPLILECSLDTDHVSLQVNFDTNITDREQMVRILKQFGHVMQQLSSDVSKKTIADLEIITASDIQEIRDWNGPIPSSVDTCLHQLFEEQVQKYPNNPAICSWDKNLSYIELDTLSTKLAHYFKSLGVGPDFIVPICFEKSTWAIVTMLAVMRAGGAFLPLDPTHPSPRLTAILNDVNATLVVTSPQTSILFKDTAFSIIQVSSTIIQELRSPPEKVASDVQPHNIAYVLFTSGSSGLPKGVVMEHSAICTSTAAIGAMLGLGAHTRVLQFSAYTFDVSVAEIFSTLTHGGCVCTPSGAQRMNDIAKFVSESNVNLACFTPSFIETIEPKDMPTLKTLILGGEAIRKANIDTWAGKLKLVNGYGPTETCILTVAYEVGSTPCRRETIGRPVSSVAWIVDPNNHQRLAPVGTIGELLLQGPTLSRGYLNDLTKTNAAFIDNLGFLANSGANISKRMYKTGDLVRYNSSGMIEYLCRKDIQVKIHGQRVELGEIEYQLKRALSTADQVVVDVFRPAGRAEDQAIVAFLSLADEIGQIDPRTVALVISESLRSKLLKIESILRKSLPSYMMPSLYIPVSSIPLSVSKKTDRKMLTATAEMLSPEQLAHYSLAWAKKRPVSTPMEESLQIIWASVLGIKKSHIGKDDSFFRLGGDSITAIKLVGAAGREHILLRILDIFENPVLSEMALVASRTTEDQQSQKVGKFALIPNEDTIQHLRHQITSQCDISDDLIEDMYPCTPLQDGLIAISTKEPGGAYIAQLVFKLPPSLNLDQFRKAWAMVSQSLPIMRTRIAYTHPLGAMQVVVKNEFNWSVDRNMDLETYLARDLEDPMQVGRPLTRYAIIRKDHFILTAHHATYDGWSIANLLGLVEKAYKNVLPAQEIGFNVFISYLMNVNQTESEVFWRNQLSGAPPPRFPASSLIPASRRPHSNLTLDYKITQSLSTDLYSNITAATIIRAAWALLVGCYEDSNDVVFGTTLSGRNAPVVGIENIMGPTIATVPIRVRFSPDQPIIDFLRSLQRQSNDMIPYEHIGLKNIKNLGEELHPACNFQSLLIIETKKGASDLGNSLGLEEIKHELENFYNYALTIEFAIDNDSIAVHVCYDKKKIDSIQVRRNIRQLEHILRQLSANINDKMIKDITIISPTEVEEINQWNAGSLRQWSSCLHSQVEQRAVDSPSSPAICARDGNMTYGQLDDYSTRFAQHLIKAGITVEDFVPFCFEKSIWSVVSMIAILKAGGVCVPLDPSHPEIRRQTILNSLSPKIVLTSLVHKHLFNLPSETETNGDLICNSIPKVIEICSDFFARLPARTKVTCNTIRPNNAAFVFFTSGTTGQPKGITVEHQSISTSSHEYGAVMKFDSSTRMLQFAAYTFDVSCGDIFTTFIHGGCLCIPSEHDRMNDLAGAIQSLNANQACLSVTVASHLDPAQTPGLKVLAVGGEPMTKELISTWANHVYLINIYGPTECSVWCSGRADLNIGISSRNIGSGIGCHLWITQADYNYLSPIGCIGELLVEGPVLARGYLSDEVMTAKAFVENPSWASPTHGDSRRFYRTGDLARYASDGTIELIGRKDTQIKMRGQRIEVGEVEYQMRQCLPPSQLELVVDLVKPEASHSNPVLVAFVCINIDSDAETASYPDILATSEEALMALAHLVKIWETELPLLLPTHMIPSIFLPITHLPLSVSGKIDRMSLRRMSSKLSAAQQDQLSNDSMGGESPRTEMEKQICKLWMTVLSIGSKIISTEDSFVRHGGDSVTAMRLVAAARAVGICLSVAQIFKHPTLRDMASEATLIKDQHVPEIAAYSLLRGDNSKEMILQEVMALSGVAKDMIEDIYPCSELQESYMALDSFHAGSSAVQNVYLIPEAIDLSRFMSAWESTVSAHAILRTRIIQTTLGYVQVVAHENAAWKYAKNLEDYFVEDQRSPMGFGDLLTRCAIVGEEKSGQRFFVLTCNHAVFDAWSMNLVISELQRSYIVGTPTPKEAKFNKFIQHITQIDKTLSDLFWQTELANVSSTPFYTSSSSSFADTLLEFKICLPEKPHPEITMATIVYAAWALVVSRNTSSRDVILKVTLTGRNAPVDSIEKIVGPLITTVPLRVQPDQDRTNQEFLHSVQHQMRKMIPYEHTGFKHIRQLSKEAQVACDLSTSIVVHPFVAPKDNCLDGINLTHTSTSILGKSPTSFLLDCTLTADGMNINVIFDSKILARDTVQKLLSRLEHAIYELLNDNMDRKLRDITFD